MKNYLFALNLIAPIILQGINAPVLLLRAQELAEGNFSFQSEKIVDDFAKLQ